MRLSTTLLIFGFASAVFAAPRPVRDDLTFSMLCTFGD